MKRREPLVSETPPQEKTTEKRPKIKLKKRTNNQEKGSFESYLKNYFDEWEEENGN